jgi:hypothetical protein
VTGGHLESPERAGPIPHPGGFYSAQAGGKIMHGIFSGAVLAAIFIGLSGCAITERSLRQRGLSPLTQGELEALYSRTRTAHGTIIMAGTTAEDVRWTYTPDGVVKVDWRQGAAEGSWLIIGGKFCRTFQVINDGQEFCVTIYKTGKNEYNAFHSEGVFIDIGTESFTFTGGREELLF